MVKGLKPQRTLDLSSYELEDSELLAVEWRKEVKEIELKLRCPVAGWPYREGWNKFLRSLGLKALIRNFFSEYLVQLAFLGVSEVRETLLSQGYTVLGRDPSDKTWMQSFMFRINDIRIVSVGADLFRFYLRAEELQLDFNFVDCMHYEVGSESWQASEKAKAQRNPPTTAASQTNQ